MAWRMGYERDPMLQALVSYCKASAPVDYHGTIAWMLPDQFRDPAYMNARRDIVDATKTAKPLGYLIEEFRIGEVSPAKVLRQMAARGITGMIFSASSSTWQAAVPRSDRFCGGADRGYDRGAAIEQRCSELVWEHNDDT